MTFALNIFLLLFAGSIPAAPAPEQAIHNFGRVNDHILRGAAPDKIGLEALAAAGVKTDVDLRPGNNDAEKREAEALGINYINIPMPGLHAPPPAALAQALKTLEDKAAWPIFVHCIHGRDRTGTVVACYRIEHDHWANSRALEEARQYGLHFTEWGMTHTILTFPK
ncbi:fused DSP-PTPase phosphatase/NAD kinase-like protein [Nevskia soli]|jgi:protein-tyrosine phosphatase|uniref:fused DSP-PTPase phosphatase/NAD kinase-like protein n=1 Tax=Nevskia soli TaxID=418856 RepID=UPI0015D7A2F8|nr:tyrosine-protein phosphatase [Nevskia soli]